MNVSGYFVGESRIIYLSIRRWLFIVRLIYISYFMNEPIGSKLRNVNEMIAGNKVDEETGASRNRRHDFDQWGCREMTSKLDHSLRWSARAPFCHDWRASRRPRLDRYRGAMTALLKVGICRSMLGGGGSVTYGMYQLINASIRPFLNTPLNYMADVIVQVKKILTQFLVIVSQSTVEL